MKNPIINLPTFLVLLRKTKKDKRIALNLNIYRNLHFQVNNQMKQMFREQIGKLVRELPIAERLAISYTLYPKTKRRCDLANICCIVDKFFCDVLVHYGILVDDSYDYLIGVQYLFGSVDPKNPRVEAKLHYHSK